MIHVMVTLKEEETGDTVMIFKLTEPEWEQEGEKVERLSERLVQLGLGGKVFRVMGYRWAGGNMTEQIMNYAPVERDRFLDGPLYYRIRFGPNKEIKKAEKVSSLSIKAHDTVAFKEVQL